MGITFKPGVLGSSDETLVDRVRYDSPAFKAGVKPGDRAVELEGKPVSRLAHLRHVLGRKYAGDSVQLTVERDKEHQTFEITLVGELAPYESAFLGVLPLRQQLDPNAKGVPIRTVFADSPAEKAGLLPRDVILRANDQELTSARQLSDIVSRIRPGEKLKLTWQHEGAEQSGETTLGSYPESVPADLSSEILPSADEPPADGHKTGRFTETLASQNRDFWAYVPEKFSPQAKYGLVVWIHPGGDTMEADIYKSWKTQCDRRGLILLGPKAEKVAGWTPLEAEYVKECVAWLTERYPIDPQRVLLHSYSSGGPFAAHLAFKYRETFRGLALASQPLIGMLPENEPDLRQQFYFICGDADPLFEAVKATSDVVRQAKFPVVLTPLSGVKHAYPSDEDLDELSRWIDCLDRI
jgi:serine protease Do